MARETKRAIVKSLSSIKNAINASITLDNTEPTYRRGIGKPINASTIATRWENKKKADIPTSMNNNISNSVPIPVGSPIADKDSMKMPAPQGPAMLLRQKRVSCL
ncbi:hypothetical protein D3C77_308870 [compost metagenome]